LPLFRPFPKKCAQGGEIARIFSLLLPFFAQNAEKARFTTIQNVIYCICYLLTHRGCFAAGKGESIMDEKKRLCKSRNNKKICGVCAGFADYLNLDPTLVRLLWALLAAFAGTGILAYFICALVMPEGDTED